MSLIRPLPAPSALAFAALLILAITLISVMPASAQNALPNGVKFVDESSTLRAGGDNYTITVQLTITEANYTVSGIGVYFESDNLAVLDIGRGTFVLTDGSGRASLNITTGPKTGNATVTAVLMSTDGDIRASKTYAVAGFSTISGTVVDGDGKGIPAATVSLYTLNNSSKGEILRVTGNPATTTGNGTYSIREVPYGSYYLEAIKENQINGYTLSVSRPAESGDISLPGYFAPTPTPTPAPTPEATPTTTPLPASPTPGPEKPAGDSLKQAGWIIGAALVLAAIIVGVQLMRQKKSRK